MSDWKSAGQAYLPKIGEVEKELGLPADLLARVAFQECSWRTAVISGEVKSAAGAVGMFQLMPEFFPGAGASWEADAKTAGEYLVKLRKRFGGWELALAAYNWGPGNVERYDVNPEIVLPAETQQYIAAVLSDVPSAEGTDA